MASDELWGTNVDTPSSEETPAPNARTTAPGRWQRAWVRLTDWQRNRRYQGELRRWQQYENSLRMAAALAQSDRPVPPDQVPTIAALAKTEVPLWVGTGQLVESEQLPDRGVTAEELECEVLRGPFTRALPVGTKVKELGGTIVVTDRRVLYLGSIRREWRYSQLTGLGHLVRAPGTILHVGNRKGISGIATAELETVPFRIAVALGLAISRRDRDGFRRHVGAALEVHHTSRPLSPTPAAAERAPHPVRFGFQGLRWLYFGSAHRSLGRRFGHFVVAVTLTVLVLGMLDSSSETTPTAAPGATSTSAPVSVITPSPRTTPVRPTPTPDSGRTAEPMPVSADESEPDPTEEESKSEAEPKVESEPKPKRTPEPEPEPEPEPVDLCGAPDNPYGYNLCGRGGHVTNPPGDICSYFNCIASFWDGSGHMIRCNDGTYGKSGGRPGSCSHHGGNDREVGSG